MLLGLQGFLSVLPASAGMIRVDGRRYGDGDGAPRIRGDDPDAMKVKIAIALCSPHPRG